MSDHTLGAAQRSNPVLDSVFARSPALATSALRCLLASKAPATSRRYLAAIAQFQAFCELSGAQFPNFTEEAVTEYILKLDSESASFGRLALVKPALTFLEVAQGRPTAFSRATDILLNGAKRRIRATAGPARKAPHLLPADLRAVLAFVFPPGCHFGHNNAIWARTAFRMIVVYHTLCRLDCYSKLRAHHFEKVGADIVITFPSAKNDQFHKGNQSCLAATGTAFCPVRITKLFFWRFGLQFGAQANDTTPLNFRLRRLGEATVPVRTGLLSRAQSTRDLQALLRAVGIATPATEKSVKMAGVSAAFAAGATPVQVMHAGRWRTPEVPLRYKHNSFEFKKQVASFVTAIPDPV